MRRPATVVVVAVVMFFAALMAILVGSALLIPGVPWSRLWDVRPGAEEAFRTVQMFAGFVLLVLGIACGAAGVGLLRRMLWAWWFAVVLFAVNGFSNVIGLLLTRDRLRAAAGILIAAAFLWSLRRRPVRDYYEIASVMDAAARH